eukprot:TRINITY_DN1389_c0_g1_i10.p1 TRINITY_DN1389_c0_g1~~TRINITY_DN1389_c0_g1_i10.p1  ORF type:complete len:316 (-),score=-20.21 TRINITY_DN1389_c0_g1_i10:606-1553(-)
MLEIQRPEVEIESLSEDGRYGVFVMNPLERGFGTTIGNSLRRVLLNSLPGAAAHSIKIDGVLHEFSTIPGVKEDVTEIILNIKGLETRLHSAEDKTVEIHKEGPCTIKAKDIIHDSEIEILNPELHIATLDKDSRLDMEIEISKGRGYVSSERNKQRKSENVIGVLPIDSLYSPVMKVNYIVENTRIEQITDYDKLVMEVWTNGVMDAKEAVIFASKILNEHFNLFLELSEEEEEEIMIERSDKVRERMLKTLIEDLDFSVRSFHCLKRAGIDTVEDLTKRTRADMANVHNLGAKSLKEIMDKMDSMGLDFADED